VATFHRDFGTWFDEKHRARYRAGNRLDMSDWKDKRPLLTGEIEAQMSLAKAETVEDIEKCLLQAAEKILGRTKAPTGRPPFRTPDARNHAQEIKQMRKALRQLRSDQHPTDSTLTALKEHLHWEPSLDTGATLLSEAILAQKGDEIRKAITLARREYKNEIWAIQRSNLDKACIKKRNNLFTKRGAIQAAMGRFHCYDQIDTLYTTHPDTVTIQVPQGSTLTTTEVEQCLHESNITAQCKPSIDYPPESGSGISITATQKHDFAALVTVTTEKGWLINSISCTTPLVQSETDLLAAITHKLGNDGRAREQICPNCKLHDKLQTLATHTGDKHGTTSLCTQCKKIVDGDTRPLLLQ